MSRRYGPPALPAATPGSRPRAAASRPEEGGLLRSQSVVGARGPRPGRSVAPEPGACGPEAVPPETSRRATGVAPPRSPWGDARPLGRDAGRAGGAGPTRRV